MKIRIVSDDGHPAHTRVLTEDGEPIEGITSIDWHIDMSGTATVRMEVVGVAMNVEGDLLPDRIVGRRMVGEEH